MNFFASGFALMNVAILVLFVVIGVYIAVLLIQFLKVGIEAFQLYIEKNR